MPVNQLMGSMPVNDENPVLRYTPNRTLTWSKFADFSLSNTVHINNYGFLNNQTYDKKNKLPLVAIIGDSFVEAAMVPYEQTYFGRLAESYDKVRFYSFGRSGAHLAQYLAYAGWVRKEFSPDILVVNIVGNDFDESFGSKGYREGFHYFEKDIKHPSLFRLDYQPGWGSVIAQRSNLFNYLFTNAQVQSLPTVLRQKFISRTSPQDFTGQTESYSTNERIDTGKLAIDHFLTLLPTMAGLPPEKIYLIIDGFRPELYFPEKLNEAQLSFFGLMRSDLLAKANSQHFQTIDLQPALVNDYAQNHIPFEFPNDGHWNARAHGIVATAIEQSTLLNNFKKLPTEQ